jgi:S-adenosylmethionine synthetase
VSVPRSSYHFTSESVSEGHPDKVCDRISDTIVDAYIAALPESRVACETLATTDRVIIAGEVRGPDSITHELIEGLVRGAIRDIGYEQPGFHWQNARIEILLHEQSADIAQGVDASGNKDEGAGDQGIMFGYACRETPELMPAPIYYAHRILKLMAEARHSGETHMLGPDAKSQVTVRYENGKPVAVTSIVVSTQHVDADLTSHDVRSIVEPYVRQALPAEWINGHTEWHVNPTGKFVIGGPDGDAGLTGRRSSSTLTAARRRMAAAPSPARTRPRSIAPPRTPRAISPRTSSPPTLPTAAPSSCPMRSAFPSRCRSMSISTAPAASTKHGSSRCWARSMDLSPRGIRQHLQLNRPIYARTAAYGHFGRPPEADGGFSWERTDLVDDLKDAIG